MNINMNGTYTMYKIRPVIKIAEEIELPKCMYRMRILQASYYNDIAPETVNQHEDESASNSASTATPPSISEKCPLPKVAVLESRQERILQQLAQLKRQMLELRAELRWSCTSPASRDGTGAPPQVEVPRDIVINANPSRPPYSILALRHMCPNLLGVHTHTHSTVSQLPGDLKQFSSTNGMPVSPLINIRLIWKNVSDTELVVSPTKHTVIKGEMNVLRYLSRLAPHRYNYEALDPVMSSLMDDVLDTCHSLCKAHLVKDKQALVRTLNTHLKKQPFLAGGDSGMCDMAAWSALRQTGCTTTKELTVSMQQWFERCTSKFSLGC